MTDIVEIAVPIKFRRISVPNYIIHETPPRSRTEGIQEAPKTAVKDLPQEALDALARAWLDDIYAKAEKPLDTLLTDKTT